MRIVFVLGPGRCGSSSVARVMHEHLRVHMGDRFRPADAENLDGFYEDLDFKEANHDVLAGALSVSEWRGKVEVLIRERSGQHAIWGFKDPRLCYLLGDYLELVQEDEIIAIRAMRQVHRVAESMSRVYGWTYGQALREAHLRESMLDRTLDHAQLSVFSIDFSFLRSDDELTNLLGGAVIYAETDEGHQGNDSTQIGGRSAISGLEQP